MYLSLLITKYLRTRKKENYIMQISMIDRKENTDYCHSIHSERKESQNNTLINTSYTQTKQVCTKDEKNRTKTSHR